MKLLIWCLKVCDCNFATSKSIKIHIEMKKILTLIFVIMSIVLPAIAQNSQEKSNSKVIELDFRNQTQKPSMLRMPMRVDIEASYEMESHTIEIIYDGCAAGEVFLYLNDTVIGYDSNINTSLQIPSIPGLYRIEIVSESWIAQGYIQL